MVEYHYPQIYVGKSIEAQKKNQVNRAFSSSFHCFVFILLVRMLLLSVSRFQCFAKKNQQKEKRKWKCFSIDDVMLHRLLSHCTEFKMCCSCFGNCFPQVKQQIPNESHFEECLNDKKNGDENFVLNIYWKVHIQIYQVSFFIFHSVYFSNVFVSVYKQQ